MMSSNGWKFCRAMVEMRSVVMVCCILCLMVLGVVAMAVYIYWVTKPRTSKVK